MIRLVCCVSFLFIGCQSPRLPIRAVAPPPSSPEETEQDLIARMGFRAEEVGYARVDLIDGHSLDQLQAQIPFVPASTSKVLTAIAALQVLGPAHTFSTELLLDGKLKGSRFEGDLSLRGSGDPLLLASHLQSLVQTLRAKGVREISGKFIVDATRFTPMREIQLGMDPDGTWNPGLSALSSEFNRIVARWKRLPTGDASFSLTPSLPLFATGLASAAPVGDSSFSFDASGASETWLLSPDAADFGTENLPVRDATTYTAQLFRSFCTMNGIQIPEAQLGIARGKVIATHRSPPVLEQVRAMLEFSNNPMAELLAMAAAQKITPSVRTFDEAASAILGWWKQQLPTLHWKGAEFKKGSGLTALNRLTPAQMTQVLSHAFAMSFDGVSFVSLLPISGWTGTLARRLTDPQVSMRVWAKTGTLAYASSLAGYVFPPSAKPFAFSLFVLDRPQMEKHQWLGALATRSELVREREWIARARGLQDALLKKWASN